MRTNIPRAAETALHAYVRRHLPRFKLGQVHPLLEQTIAEFILRPGKRIRPVFFLLSYQGFSCSGKIPGAVLSGSLAFELLHDFLLVHDDIIDNSATRRGKPTMHLVFERALRQSAKIGQDLAIVAADIMHALSIEAFLNIPSPQSVKEQALRYFLKATIRTGAGEYKDVVNGLLPIDRVGLKDIRQNYRLKTAEYTFAAPLACGCLLAGGTTRQADHMARFGRLLGEAFQIQDDMIGLFGSSVKIGKSVLSDLQEAKKTLPLYYAYIAASLPEKRYIKTCLGNPQVRYRDLQKIRTIIKATGAAKKTTEEIARLVAAAAHLLARSTLRTDSKQAFRSFISQNIMPETTPAQSGRPR